MYCAEKSVRSVRWSIPPGWGGGRSPLCRAKEEHTPTRTPGPRQATTPPPENRKSLELPGLWTAEVSEWAPRGDPRPQGRRSQTPRLGSPRPGEAVQEGKLFSELVLWFTEICSPYSSYFHMFLCTILNFISLIILRQIQNKCRLGLVSLKFLNTQCGGGGNT